MIKALCTCIWSGEKLWESWMFDRTISLWLCYSQKKAKAEMILSSVFNLIYIFLRVALQNNVSKLELSHSCGFDLYILLSIHLCPSHFVQVSIENNKQAHLFNRLLYPIPLIPRVLADDDGLTSDRLEWYKHIIRGHRRGDLSHHVEHLQANIIRLVLLIIITLHDYTCSYYSI